jgi:hypothetical protein
LENHFVLRKGLPEILKFVLKINWATFCVSEAGQHAQEGHKGLIYMQAPGFTLHLLEAKDRGEKAPAEYS